MMSVSTVKGKNRTVLCALAALVVAGCLQQVYGEGFDRKAFTDPAPEFSASYFWMWNDRLDVEKLCSQLEEMHSHGIRSVCVHPVPKAFRPARFTTAMEPDYLTPAYMEVLKKVSDRAAELGMNFWLYDEGGWPSGGACGLVAESDPEGRFNARTLVAAENATGYEIKREYYGEGRNSYPSIIEKGAAERFIEITHEQLKKHLGGEFGKSIKFAFMDEPEWPRNIWRGELGWTSDFLEVFKAKKGYDISPYLADIVRRQAEYVPELVPHRIAYYEVISDLFVERFMLPLRSWCRANGLLSSGHVDGEDCPDLAVRYGNGNLLKTLRAMDAPGVDVIWRQLFPTSGNHPGQQVPFPRYASSAAHHAKNRYVLSESFGIYGDSVTPDQMKWLVDYQMVRGVNLFVFGYYAMSNSGQWMTLFEPHSGPVQPYWDFQPHLFRYMHRVSSMLASGLPATDIAVFYDARGFWAGGPDTAVAAGAHYMVAKVLDEMNCDYDFVDDDPIIAAPIVDGALEIGDMKYRTIVVPSSKWMKAETRKKLSEFKAAGGRVLDPESICEVKRTCRMTGTFASAMRVAKRVKGSEALYFIVNETPYAREVNVRFDESGPVVRGDIENGLFEAVPMLPDGSFSMALPGCGSALFLVGSKPDKPAPPHFTEPVVTNFTAWTVRPLIKHFAGTNDFEVAAATSGKEFTVEELCDWCGFLGADFSGKVQYRTEFEWDGAGELELDLGKVHWCCSVKFNGKDLGYKFFGPFRWRVTPKKGRNTIEVVVANTLANAVSAHSVRDRITKDFPPRSPYEDRLREFDHSNLESGLLGPVMLKSVKLP